METYIPLRREVKKQNTQHANDGCYGGNKVGKEHECQEGVSKF